MVLSPRNVPEEMYDRFAGRMIFGKSKSL